MNKTLVEKLRGRSHTSVYYRTERERLDFLTAYFADGLAQGELCLWVTQTPADTALVDLEAAGRSFRAHKSLGAFQIFDSVATYLPNGSFKLANMMDNLSKFLVNSEKEGFTGLRTAGEMRWMVGNSAAEHEAIQYEHEVNVFMEDNGFTGVCLYHLGEMSEQSIQGSLRTHPQFVYQNELYANAYYLPSAQFNAVNDSDPIVKSLPFFSQLEALTDSDGHKQLNFDQAVKAVLAT